MIFKSINDQPNQYNNTNGTFKREGDRIIISTTKGNIREIEVNYNIEDLIGIDDIQIRFIVRIGNDLYTSTELINDLIKARNENNPYFTLDYIIIIDINEELIDTTIDELGDVESKVNVNMEKTLDTPEDIIKQIDWATRSVPIDGSEPSHAELIGQWSVSSFPNRLFDMNNSVRVKDRQDIDQQDEDVQNDDETQPETAEEESPVSVPTEPPNNPSPRDPRRDQPRTGGGRLLI